MDNNILIWLGIFVAVVVAGANEPEKWWIRYVGLIAVGILMLAFYME